MTKTPPRRLEPRPHSHLRMKDLTKVVPTGRVVGAVFGVYNDSFSLLVKVEEWFVESEVFKMGTWRKVAPKPM